MRRLLPRSIRARLTAVATLAAALVFTVTSVITLTTAPDNLRGVVQSRVELAVRRVAAEARIGELTPVVHPPARVGLMEVVAADGTVIASSPGFPQGLRLATASPPRSETVETSEREIYRGPDDPRAHYLVMAMTTRTPRGPVTVYGASSLSDVDRALRWIYLLTFLGTPLILVSVAGITWLTVGSALRPVERIRAEMAEITGQDLTRRVPVPETGDEIADLATTTNDTLDRLERSAETQRRFVADASHELRSPISALRAQLEVANAYPEETDWKTTGERALAAADRLTGIIDELLMLARLDAGAVAERRVVDLAQVADHQVRRREGSRVPVLPDLCAAAPVLGSPMQLDRLLTNLLDNAVRHAATRVDLEVSVRGDKVVVTVTDDGEGIPPQDRERVFERFTRLESARAKDKGGSGLGLPLSREIAMAHGGTLTLTGHAPGARFTAVLPLYGPP
ncbi:HAMP domain-containing protein [Nonomuraea phyllanthi]|uniref:histidine kinase n=1 Tax=Nonomuraea phyllanthi TaxID=2219224 RepID=A0A5C4VFZ9_9ACTN|nr:HAMP domain-containing sensor histidine kinase [Nonomuraea phyllanthi]KAB8188721.1 HAMP domain-containing protein [Nonomuraea phyllanthi]